GSRHDVTYAQRYSVPCWVGRAYFTSSLTCTSSAPDSNRCRMSGRPARAVAIARFIAGLAWACRTPNPGGPKRVRHTELMCSPADPDQSSGGWMVRYGCPAPGSSPGSSVSRTLAWPDDSPDGSRAYAAETSSGPSSRMDGNSTKAASGLSATVRLQMSTTRRDRPVIARPQASTALGGTASVCNSGSPNRTRPVVVHQ